MLTHYTVVGQLPGSFGNHLKRTFQRRVKAWKALNGPDKEIMFRQSKEAGRLGLSDFTELNGITITIVNEALKAPIFAAYLKP